MVRRKQGHPMRAEAADADEVQGGGVSETVVMPTSVSPCISSPTTTVTSSPVTPVSLTTNQVQATDPLSLLAASTSKILNGFSSGSELSSAPTNVVPVIAATASSARTSPTINVPYPSPSASSSRSTPALQQSDSGHQTITTAHLDLMRILKNSHMPDKTIQQLVKVDDATYQLLNAELAKSDVDMKGIGSLSEMSVYQLNQMLNEQNKAKTRARKNTEQNKPNSGRRAKRPRMAETHLIQVTPLEGLSASTVSGSASPHSPSVAPSRRGSFVAERPSASFIRDDAPSSSSGNPLAALEKSIARFEPTGRGQPSSASLSSTSSLLSSPKLPSMSGGIGSLYEFVGQLPDRLNPKCSEDDASAILTCTDCGKAYSTMDQLVQHKTQTGHFSTVPKSSESWQSMLSPKGSTGSSSSRTNHTSKVSSTVTPTSSTTKASSNTHHAKTGSKSTQETLSALKFLVANATSKPSTSTPLLNMANFAGLSALGQFNAKGTQSSSKTGGPLSPSSLMSTQLASLTSNPLLAMAALQQSFAPPTTSAMGPMNPLAALMAFSQCQTQTSENLAKTPLKMKIICKSCGERPPDAATLSKHLLDAHKVKTYEEWFNHTMLAPTIDGETGTMSCQDAAEYLQMHLAFSKMSGVSQTPLGAPVPQAGKELPVPAKTGSIIPSG